MTKFTTTLSSDLNRVDRSHVDFFRQRLVLLMSSSSLRDSNTGCARRLELFCS